MRLPRSPGGRAGGGARVPVEARLRRAHRVRRAQRRPLREAASGRRPSQLPRSGARPAEIYTTATEADLDRRLLDLYRLARNGFEEGGANILYLAIGFLSWTRKEGEAAYRAPLLLVPVALKRSSVRAGFRLALHDDEVRINPTLLEMLREDFRLRMPELEGELPRDASGIDVDGIMRIVRGHVPTCAAGRWCRTSCSRPSPSPST